MFIIRTISQVIYEKKKIFHLLASKKAVVGIVGAGYVGLPLAQLISKKI